MFYSRAMDTWPWRILTCHVWLLANLRYPKCFRYNLGSIFQHQSSLKGIEFSFTSYRTSLDVNSATLQLLLPTANEKKKQTRAQQAPIFMAEPMRASNSFVGTEEYIAPVLLANAFPLKKKKEDNYLICNLTRNNKYHTIKFLYFHHIMCYV